MIVARWRTIAAGLVLAGVLGACASLAPPSADLLTGRLSVQIAATPGAPARSINAGFELRGNADDGELRLNNPFGMQMAAARWQRGSALLRTSQGETRFDDLDALSERAFGEAVPLRALPDWLQGRPWPGAPSHDADNGFEQLGWSVDLSRLAAGHIAARRAPGPAAPAVTVRAIVERPS